MATPMPQGKRDNPGVMFFPPALHLAMLVVGLVLHFLFPLPFLPFFWQQLVIGVPLIGIGVILGEWAVWTMKRGGTAISSYESTTSIVAQGPFRFSRNPLYLSLTIAYIGVAVAVNTLWSLVLLPVALLGITLGVIKREERYLERKFGQEYLSYKTRVRRWL